MAKKKDKEKEKAKASDKRAGRTDAVRAAVDQAFQTGAAQSVAAADAGREAAQDIVDQLAQAAGRVRDVLDELRPPTGDDVKSLRSSIDALEQRVAALEAAASASAATPKPKRTTTRRTTGTQTAAKRRSTGGSAGT